MLQNRLNPATPIYAPINAAINLVLETTWRLSLWLFDIFESESSVCTRTPFENNHPFNICANIGKILISKSTTKSRIFKTYQLMIKNVLNWPRLYQSWPKIGSGKWSKWHQNSPKTLQYKKIRIFDDIMLSITVSNFGYRKLLGLGMHGLEPVGPKKNRTKWTVEGE